MRAIKALLLFVIGFFLALMTFPIAFFVSVALGYLFGITAILIGAYMIAKREKRKLPLILGILLLIISIPALLGTAVVHMGVLIVGKAVEEATKRGLVEGRAGEALKLDDWRITVVGVREAVYIRKGEDYYKAKEGYKAVIVRLRIENTGKETESLSTIWDFVLVTDAGKSYEKESIYSLDRLWSKEVTEEVKKSAVEFVELNTWSSIAPGSYIEGDILFLIPNNESPDRLHFKVGVIGGHEVKVKLSP